MSHLLILCRHGNTFEKGDSVVMVGAREDLPLTQEGIRQAQRVAYALSCSATAPSSVVCGPLQRTVQFAQTVGQDLGLVGPVSIDARLIELDYGAWGGLSQEAIVRLYGEESWRAWQEDGARPTKVGVCFSPSEEQVHSDVVGMLSDYAAYPETESRVSLVVTSNGRLRAFGRILDPHAPASHKVKTGHACVARFEGDSWRILGWDLSPDQLAVVLKSHAA